jgi:peptidyl-tRNA hydrolase
MPAFNRIADQKKNLRISGFSDATIATNTLKSILQNVKEANNQLREAIGRPEVEYGSALDQILQQFNVTEDNELVKQAMDAIKQQPQFQEQILDSLLNKLKQQSGS